MTSVYYEQVADAGWLAAVAGRRMLLLKSAGEAADALWAAIASPKGVQATLDELTRGGVSTAPPFALIEWGDELGSRPCTVRIIVRGDVAVTVHSADGDVTTDASAASTWLERDVTAATGLEVRAGSRAASGSTLVLPLLSGVVVTDRVTVGADAVAPTPPAPAAAGASAPALALAPAPATASAPTTAPASVPSASTAAEVPGRWPDPEATVAGMTVTDLAEPHADHAPDATSADPTDGSYDYLFGETVFRKVEDAAVRMDEEPSGDATPAVPVGPIAGESGDHDGHTVASIDIAKLRATRKARKAEATVRPPAQPPAPSLYLELADGSHESLAQPVLVGRAPSADKVSGARMPRLLTVSGTDQDISRNHVQFAVEGGTVVVTDLHSRNGTTAILPGRAPQQLRQGEPTSVIVGTVIDLGGGVTFTVCEE